MLRIWKVQESRGPIGINLGTRCYCCLSVVVVVVVAKGVVMCLCIFGRQHEGVGPWRRDGQIFSTLLSDSNNLDIQALFRIRVLAEIVVLCSWVKPFTLTVSLSSQMYNWLPVN